ncbi:MAG: general secretion pathway protein GspE [Myxococcaceae bacterium]|nr:general secretion pathway protein GspE [Myxococcaceae bacterium]MCI0671120.1 general secretion pathway protein GspE [Myxococcaceae bacterium]
MQPRPRSSPPTRNRIAAVLLEAGLVTREQLLTALQQQEHWGGRLTRQIEELGYATEEAMTAAVERGLRIPRLRLATVTPTAAALSRVDAELAEARGVLPVAFQDGGRTLLLAMADPTDVATMDEVARRSQTRVQPAVVGDREVEAAILRHYHGVDAAPAPSAAGPDGVTEKLDVAPDLLGASARADSAANLLEELLTGEATQPGTLTAEEQHRLALLKQNQVRSGRVLRALLELLVEKGVLTQAALAARLRG